MATHCTSIVMETTSSCGLFYLFDFTPHPFGRQWSERLLWLRPQRDYLAAFFLIKSAHCVSLLLLRQPQLLLLLLLLLLPLLLLVENTVCSWQMPKAAAKLSTCNRTKCGRTYCNFESTQLDAILDAIRDARVRLKAVSNASKVQLRSHTHTSTLCALDCSIAVAHLLLKFGVGFRFCFFALTEIKFLSWRWLTRPIVGMLTGFQLFRSYYPQLLFGLWNTPKWQSVITHCALLIRAFLILDSVYTVMLL